jgi:hypothetical protein
MKEDPFEELPEGGYRVHFDVSDAPPNALDDPRFADVDDVVPFDISPDAAAEAERNGSSSRKEGGAM